MKDLVLNKLMSIIIRDTNHDETKLIEIRYGLEGLFITVGKLSVFIIISIILGTFVNLLLFLLFFIPLKSTCFGFHAKKSWQCWMISSLAFIGLPLLANYLILNTITKIICISFIFIFVFLYCPADTPNRPIVSPIYRRKLKITALTITLIYSCIILSFSSLAGLIILASLYQCFLINPLTYKLFDLQYNNYINYGLERSINYG